MDIIDNNSFEIILKHVNLLCPNKRTPKYTPDYYLSNIIDILSDFVKWSSLRKSKFYKSSNHYHYKTISKIHKKLSDKGVYFNAFNEIILKNNNLYLSNDNTFELLIDSTLIINKSGIECVGYGSKCKKKKYTKITGLSNT